MDSVPPSKAGDQSNQSQQTTILVVDDNEDNLLLLSYVLEESGYLAVQGSCGEEAIDLAAQCKPDLILLDILLPDMNGMIVIRHLRKQRALRNVPIIAVTALARPTEQANIIAAGFTDYIAKPYMLDDIQALIARYIDGWASLRIRG